MENASKALLIAGAVLIVIVLISVGMLIVNQASSVTDQASDSMTGQAVDAFNNQFQNYAGIQKGSSIKTLLSSISTSNATNKSTSNHIITVDIVDTVTTGAAGTGLVNATDITKKVSEIINSAKYKVELTAKDTEGYISAITITRQ